jgi:hypothetical protein
MRILSLSVSHYRYCVEIVTWKAPRQPPYILTCRSILPADHRSHFSYLLPHHFYPLRVYIEPPELHLQSSRSCISTLCKAHSYEPGLPIVLHLIFTQPVLSNQSTTSFKKSLLLLPLQVSRASSFIKRTDDQPRLTNVPN